MASAEGGDGGGEAASLSLITTMTSNTKYILEKMTTAARAVKSKLWRPPPPLPVTQKDLRQLEIGKLVFMMGTAATIGLLFYDHFAVGEAHYYVILGMMGGCAAVLNGILFETTPLEVAGIGLILLSFDVLVASFLPLKFWWACWIFAAFSLTPLLYLLINPSAPDQPASS